MYQYCIFKCAIVHSFKVVKNMFCNISLCITFIENISLAIHRQLFRQQTGDFFGRLVFCWDFANFDICDWKSLDYHPHKNSFSFIPVGTFIDGTLVQLHIFMLMLFWSVDDVDTTDRVGVRLWNLMFQQWIFHEP